MSVMPSFGTILNADVAFEPSKSESPFRILLLADFSGRQNRGETGTSDEVAARKLIRVARDTLDDVMAKLAVQLKLPVGEDDAEVSLSFATLDDFHPDQLCDRVDYIADQYDEDDKSAAMNKVLHHPDFQSLEATWRGLAWLLTRAARGGPVEVVLLDVTLPELSADLTASEDLTLSGLHRLVVEKGVRSPQGEPWALLLGDYLFDLTAQHADLLGRLAKIATQAGGPFLTTAHPRVLDKSFAMSADDAPAWQALRRLPEAALLGLVVPRFLLRVPYGENTQSIDKFSYNEIAGTPDRSHYLWGNPALGCAALFAQTFQREGWAGNAGAILNLDNLPLHVYTVDGDQEVTLAEAWLVRPQTEQLVKQGIMPFLCVKGKADVQLLRFLSAGEPAPNQPPIELWGRWGQTGVAPPASAAALGGAKVGLVEQAPGKTAPAPAKPAAPAPAPKASAPKSLAPPVSSPTPGKAPVVVSAPAAVAPPPAAPQPPAPAEPAPEPEAATSEPTPEEPAPAEEEMDPDLAALLKQLE